MESSSTSRKFIDLIFKASGKLANWNPPYEIKVGDYGELERQTGEFSRKGNIYEDTHIYEDKQVVELVKKHPPKVAPREDVYTAASAKVKRSDLILGPKVEIAGLAEASIKGQWTFGSKRGALLLMAHPRSSYMPGDTLLKHLAKVQALDDMFLVTEVFLCPAYSLYLSSGDSEVVSLALVGSLPVPHAPGVTVGAGVEGKWWVENTAGLFRSARDRHGQDNFTPLYMLKRIQKKTSWFHRRGENPSPVELEGDDLWGDIQVPWDQLDENGNEEEFEDTVFD